MTTCFAAIVIPCLNEERSLLDTCKSLGFATGQSPPRNAVLILVDNGSEDRTLSVADAIRAVCPTGSVIVATEAERGYVPPRRRGNLVAMSAADDRGVSKEQLLIIQADADTLYSDGYVDALVSAATRCSPGVIIDSVCASPNDSSTAYRRYIALCDEVDATLAMPIDQSQDVIVDDKACAYRASDYELWGGHQREFSCRGEEIHSETTRLYIRARTFGAMRYLCEDAIAQHSDRRIVGDPAYSFATAGFPRECSFRTRWQRLYDGPNDITEFCKAANRAKISLAVRYRRAHMNAIFHLLTAHVRRTVEPANHGDLSEHQFITDLPRRDARTARERPGLLIEDVLGKVEDLVNELIVDGTSTI